MKLSDLLSAHWAENPGLSFKHRDDYESKLSRFAEFVERDPTVADLTPEIISRFMTTLLDESKSTFTVNRYRTVLLLVARRADELGLIRRIPRVKKLREPKRIPRGFDSSEMSRILVACRRAPALPLRSSPGKPKGTFSGIDWEIYFRLVWETGARPTSLRTLRFMDISGGYYRIDGANTKTKLDKSDRLSPELLDLIESRRRERGAEPFDLIIDWPCGHRHLWSAMKKHIIKPAGLEGALYCALKGAVSYIARERGVFAAAQFRGHADVKTTIKSYIVPRIAFNEESACDILPRIG